MDLLLRNIDPIAVKSFDEMAKKKSHMKRNKIRNVNYTHFPKMVFQLVLKIKNDID